MSGQPRAGGAGGRTSGGPRGTSGAKYTPADGSGETSSGPKQPGSGKIDDVNEKLNSVRAVMTDNMKKTLDRGQQLEDIEQKSEVLLVDANKFQESAAATKKMFCRRHWRNIIMISLIAAVILAIIIWAVASH